MCELGTTVEEREGEKGESNESELQNTRMIERSRPFEVAKMLVDKPELMAMIEIEIRSYLHKDEFNFQPLIVPHSHSVLATRPLSDTSVCCDSLP